jgi:UDP-N-acetylglucosamine:LPS N-acetylglucosamine transferase
VWRKPMTEPIDGVDGDLKREVWLVCSSGGHLAQLLALRPWWERRSRRWVTFRTPDAESLLATERVVWAHHPTTRHLGNLVRNTLLALRMLVARRPEVVVSTGAGVALPFFVLAWVMRIPTVYIEVYDRLDSATLTGRLCRPFTRLMLVQWPDQLAIYPGSKLIGALL